MTPCAGTPMIDVGNGLLYPAMRKAGITLGPGRTPSNAQFQDAIDELNRLIGSLNCDRMFIYSLDPLSLAITSGTGSWTIGCDSGATFQTPRPASISQAYLVDTTGTRTQVTVATPQQWAERNNHTCDCESGVQLLYYDAGYPVATIYLRTWITNPQSLELWVWHSIPRFTDVSNAVVLPPGYEDLLTLNLAVRLGPHFQRAIDPALRADAREALMRVESLNAPKPIAALPSLGRCC